MAKTNSADRGRYRAGWIERRRQRTEHSRVLCRKRVIPGVVSRLEAATAPSLPLQRLFQQPRSHMFHNFPQR